MLLLGLDVETTGLDEKNDFITEIGAALYDTEMGEMPVKQISFLINEKGRKPLEPIIPKLTGITDIMLEKYSTPAQWVLGFLCELYDDVDYIVAHNASFDRAMLMSFISRYTEDIKPYEFKPKKWINTTTDLPLDRELCKFTNLTYLQAFHEILNPFPHRAITDVMTMMKIFFMYDTEEIIKRAESPTVRIWCKPGFHGKDAPKKAGFYYNGDDKTWFKEFKECDLDQEKYISNTLYDFQYNVDHLGAQ